MSESMRLRVVLPRFSPAIEGVVMYAWHKSPGDQVAYGDHLCDVVVEEITKMRRPISALAKKKESPTYGTLDVSVRYRLTSLDSGQLESLSVQPGGAVAVGEVMAVIEAEGGEGEADARSVVNLVDPESDDL